MKGLFLDDERNPSDVTWVNYVNKEDIEWTVVRTYNEFVNAISADNFDCYSFDHDLQDYEMRPMEPIQSAFGEVAMELDDVYQERTGADCARELVKTKGKIEIFYIHSKNPIGCENILSIMA